MDKYEAARLLDVAAAETPDEIKRAWLRAAKQWHPQNNPSPGAEERFKQLQEAWDTLKRLLKENPKCLPIGRPPMREMETAGWRGKATKAAPAPQIWPAGSPRTPPPGGGRQRWGESKASHERVPRSPGPRPAQGVQTVFVFENSRDLLEALRQPAAVVGNGENAEVRRIHPIGTPQDVNGRGQRRPPPPVGARPNPQALAIHNAACPEERAGRPLGSIVAYDKKFQVEATRAMANGGTVTLPPNAVIRDSNGNCRSGSGLSITIRERVAYYRGEPFVLIVVPV